MGIPIQGQHSRCQSSVTHRQVAWEEGCHLPRVTEASAMCFNAGSFDAVVLIRRAEALCGASIDFPSYVHKLSPSVLQQPARRSYDRPLES